MRKEQEKKLAAEAALQYVKPHSVIGVGTGSTTHYFIEALSKAKIPLEGVVASSHDTEKKLRAHHLPVVDPNGLTIASYIDGADEYNGLKQLIKGGGGALTREKIIAAMAVQFICIVDSSKQMPIFGTFPLPIEVHPMARSLVGREIVKLGGQPSLRTGFTTDNGNLIIDAYHLSFQEPMQLEETLNNITGVICHGLFAKRGADIMLVGKGETVVTF